MKNKYDFLKRGDPWFEQLLSTGRDVLSDFIRDRETDVIDIRAGGAGNAYESPIEQALAIAISARINTNIGDFKFWARFGLTAVEATQLCEEHLDTFSDGGVFPQVLIDKYRVDFLFLYRRRGDFGGLVVQCDGHDFHERTKEQAMRDRSCDRRLQELGYKVFRFTGSEIWKDAFGCADTVVRFALNEVLSNSKSGGAN